MLRVSAGTPGSPVEDNGGDCLQARLLASETRSRRVAPGLSLALSSGLDPGVGLASSRGLRQNLSTP